jgi:hypothetical protein
VGEFLWKDVYCDRSSFSRGSLRSENSLARDPIRSEYDQPDFLNAEGAEENNAEIQGELSAPLRVLCELCVPIVQNCITLARTQGELTSQTAVRLPFPTSSTSERDDIKKSKATK